MIAKKFRRWVLPTQIMVSCTIITTLILIKTDVITPLIKSTDKRQTHSSQNFSSSKNSFKVLILPFHPDKNCVIEYTHYEEILLERFQQINNKDSLNIEAIFISHLPCPSDPNEATSIGNEYNANIVLWGNYEEECDGPSKLCINYSIVNSFNIIVDDTLGSSGMKYLDNLDDLRLGFLQEDIDLIITLIIAINYLQCNNIDKSIETLSILLKKDSCDLATLLFLEEICMNAHKWDTAQIFITQAIKCRPTDAILYANRGDCFAGLHNFENAINDYNKALTLEPVFIHAFVNKVYCMLGVSPVDEYKINYIDLKNDNSVDDFRIYCAFGRFGNQVYQIDSALNHKVHDGFSEITSAMQAVMKANKLDKNINDLHELIRLNILYGDIKQINQDYAGAIDSYTNVLEWEDLNSIDRELNERLYISRSLMYRYLENDSLMNKDVDSALAINPNSMAIFVRFPQYYWESIKKNKFKPQQAIDI
jgi:tetratricopeptide (TPR) repeat protein